MAGQGKWEYVDLFVLLPLGILRVTSLREMDGVASELLFRFNSVS